MAGTFLETYAVSEILKTYIHNGRKPHLYFYRDKEKREVDLMIEENGTLYPIEIKKTGSPASGGFKGFDCLRSLKVPIGHGAVICFVNGLIPIGPEIDAVPVGYI